MRRQIRHQHRLRRHILRLGCRAHAKSRAHDIVPRRNGRPRGMLCVYQEDRDQHAHEFTCNKLSHTRLGQEMRSLFAFDCVDRIVIGSVTVQGAPASFVRCISPLDETTSGRSTGAPCGLRGNQSSAILCPLDCLLRPIEYRPHQPLQTGDLPYRAGHNHRLLTHWQRS